MGNKYTKEIADFYRTDLNLPVEWSDDEIIKVAREEDPEGLDEVQKEVYKGAYTGPVSAPEESLWGKTKEIAGAAFEAADYAATDVNERTKATANAPFRTSILQDPDNPLTSPLSTSNIAENASILGAKGVMAATEVGKYVGGKADDAVSSINANIDKLPMGLAQFVKYNPMLQGPKHVLGLVGAISPRTPTQTAFSALTAGSPKQIASTIDKGVAKIGQGTLAASEGILGATLSPAQRAAAVGTDNIGSRAAKWLEGKFSETSAARNFADTATAVEHGTIKANLSGKLTLRSATDEGKAAAEIERIASEKIKAATKEQDAIMDEVMGLAKNENLAREAEKKAQRIIDLKIAEVPGHPLLERNEVIGKELVQAVGDSHKKWKKEVVDKLYTAARKAGDGIWTDPNLLRAEVVDLAGTTKALAILKEDKTAVILSDKINKALEGTLPMSSLMELVTDLNTYARSIGDEGTKRVIGNFTESIGNHMVKMAETNPGAKDALELFWSANQARTREALWWESKGMEHLFTAGELNPGSVVDFVAKVDSPVTMDQVINASPRAVGILRKGSFERGVEAIKSGKGLASYKAHLGGKRYNTLHTGTDDTILKGLDEATKIINDKKGVELKSNYEKTVELLEQAQKEKESGLAALKSGTAAKLKEGLASLERAYGAAMLDRRVAAGAAKKVVERRSQRLDEDKIATMAGGAGASALAVGYATNSKTTKNVGVSLLAVSALWKSPKYAAKVYYSPAGRAAMEQVIQATDFKSAMQAMFTLEQATKGLGPLAAQMRIGAVNRDREKKSKPMDWSFLKGKKPTLGMPNPTPDTVIPYAPSQPESMGDESMTADEIRETRRD